MMGIIKLIVLAYLVFMGLFVTFGVVWLRCGLELTKNAACWIAFLSFVVGTVCVLWMVR